MRRALALVCTGLLAFIAQAGATETKTVTLASDRYCPYSCVPGGIAPGFAVEYARAAFAEKGWTLIHRQTSWADAIAMAERGEVDGVIAVCHDTAPTLTFPETPIAPTTTGFVVRGGDDWRYRRPEDLAGRRIGLVAGYAYGEPFDSILATLPADQLVWTDHDEPLVENFRKLAAGELDLVMDDELVLKWTLIIHDLASLKLAPRHETTVDDPLFFGFTDSPRGRAIAAGFDIGAAAARERGVLDRLLRRYGLHPDTGS